MAMKTSMIQSQPMAPSSEGASAQIAHIMGQMKLLHDHINLLNDRLNPVLSPLGPSTSTGNTKSENYLPSLVEQELYTIRTGLEAAIDSINSMSNRSRV